MKKLLMILALTGSLHADIVGPSVVQQLDGPTSAPISGSLTYALNQALTGTASTAIDLNGAIGVYLTLTSTGSANVDLKFTNANSTASAKTYTLQSNNSYWVPMRGRYLTLYNSGTNLPTARTSAYYYAAVPSAGATSITNTVTISGTVTANQGAAGAEAWPVSLTNIADTAATSYFDKLTTGATTMAYWRTVSATTRTLTTGAVSLNLTQLAGTDSPVIFKFSGLGPNAGFLWDTDNAATPVSGIGNYYAVSTTPIWQSGATPSGPGEHLHFTPTAAAVTQTIQVRILIPGHLVVQ